ncbi:MAG: diphthamide synthesis protein [Candidatus Altiarchaeota archaeon]
MKKLFIPAEIGDFSLPKNIPEGLEGRVGVVTTAQHLRHMKDVELFLKTKGLTPIRAGQIIGCNISNALKVKDSVDCFLYVGTGRFHPIEISLNAGKPVYALNPIDGKIEAIPKEELKRWERKRKAQVALAVKAETFGILVSTKEKQYNMIEALALKKKLEGSGRKAFLFIGEELNPDNVLPFKVDAWINTACPRIADDFFKKPVLNPGEVSYILDQE